MIKKVLKLMLLVTALTNSLIGGIVFDLDRQQFSNSLNSNYKIYSRAGRYELPQVYVTVGMKYHHGFYEGGSGKSFNVEMKQPLLSWNVSMDILYNLYTKTHTTRFTSDTAEAIQLSFSKGKVYFNGNAVFNLPTNRNSHTFSITVSKYNDTVSLRINGSMSTTITVPNFSKLKFVNAAVLYDTSYGGTGHQSDKLYGLNIGTSD